jgi:hypothetical protein
LDLSTAQVLADRATKRWLETSRAQPTRSLEIALVRAAREHGHLSDLSLLSAALTIVPHAVENLRVFRPEILIPYLHKPSQQAIGVRQKTSLSLRYLIQDWYDPTELGQQPKTYTPGEDYRVDPILEWKNSQPSWSLRGKSDEYLIVDIAQWLRATALWFERNRTLRASHPIFSYVRHSPVRGDVKAIAIKELRRIASAIADVESLTDSHESLAMIPSGNRLILRPFSHLAHGLVSASYEPSAEAVAAASLEPSVSAFGFGVEAIAELEDLINSPISREQDLQSFFEAYPYFLLGLDYGRLIAQPLLRRKDEPDLIPDFVLLPLDSNTRFPKIVDLKLPTEKVFRREKNRQGYLSAVHKARDQLLEYQRYFSQTASVQEASMRWGQEIFMPEICVVIGRSASFASSLERQRARISVPDLEVITYDDVLSAGRRLVDWSHNS